MRGAWLRGLLHNLGAGVPVRGGGVGGAAGDVHEHRGHGQAQEHLP